MGLQPTAVTNAARHPCGDNLYTGTSPPRLSWWAMKDSNHTSNHPSCFRTTLLQSAERNITQILRFFQSYPGWTSATPGCPTEFGFCEHIVTKLTSPFCRSMLRRCSQNASGSFTLISVNRFDCGPLDVVQYTIYIPSPIKCWYPRWDSNPQKPSF